MTTALQCGRDPPTLNRVDSWQAGPGHPHNSKALQPPCFIHAYLPTSYTKLHIAVVILANPCYSLLMTKQPEPTTPISTPVVMPEDFTPSRLRGRPTGVYISAGLANPGRWVGHNLVDLGVRYSSLRTNVYSRNHNHKNERWMVSYAAGDEMVYLRCDMVEPS